MDKWEPSYRGEPRPDNRTFALAQKAIDNGWNPAGRNKLISYRFIFLLTTQYIELHVEGMENNPYGPLKVSVSDFIFNKKFAKALVGPKRYRKLLTGAVLSRSPVDYMYREVIDRTAKIGRRL
jgi:hypothetical protein